MGKLEETRGGDRTRSRVPRTRCGCGQRKFCCGDPCRGVGPLSVTAGTAPRVVAVAAGRDVRRARGWSWVVVGDGKARGRELVWGSLIVKVH